jgi:hypothetical protein
MVPTRSVNNRLARAAVLLGALAGLLALGAGCSTTEQSVATPPPAWIETLPQEKDAVYAVGHADRSYYGEELEDATSAARAELGRTLESKVRSVVVGAMQGELGGPSSEYVAEVFSNVSESALSGSQRIEWWKDHAGAKGPRDRTYVLVKLTRSMLIESLRKEAKKAPPEGGPEQMAVTEEAIDKAFKELDKELAKRNQ